MSNSGAGVDVVKLAFFWAGCWLLFGLFVDSLHGIKASSYLAEPIRREMWRLAHAHGMLLSLFFVVAHRFLGFPKKPYERLMIAGAVLLPVGFFLGGLFPTSTDPSVGVLLVPLGGLCFAVGLLGNLLHVVSKR